MDRLIKKIIEKNNPTVVGLDPSLELVPDFLKQASYQKYGETLKGAAKAVIKFNKRLIDALCGIVPAVKPQLAFYEALGVEGIKAFHETIEYARARGMYVIADAKRGDIGSTAQAYADAFLSTTRIGINEYSPFPADALTVNAYLGTDGVMPFVNACEKNDKGIFVLVKTSNPSSGELQDRQCLICPPTADSPPNTANFLTVGHSGKASSIAFMTPNRGVVSNILIEAAFMRYSMSFLVSKYVAGTATPPIL